MALLPGFPFDLRVCRCSPSAELRLKRADGLWLAARLYRPQGSSARGSSGPAVLLLHGNTPSGSGLALYRVLATHLAQRGYTVLAVDFAGFGRSEDPFPRGTPEALRQGPDALAGLRGLQSVPGVDPDRIYVVGHSMGSKAALLVGLREPAVRAVALIGPPRRDPELLKDERSVEYFYERALATQRALYGKPLPAWYTKEVFNAERIATSIERSVPALREPGHKPLLLIDGSREEPENLAYLDDYYQRIGPPKSLARIPDSNHYVNTTDRWGAPVYDVRVVRATVDALDDWMRRGPVEQPDSSETSAGPPG